MWPTCPIRKKRRSSSRKLPAPHTSASSRVRPARETKTVWRERIRHRLQWVRVDFTAKENSHDTANQECGPGAWSFRRWLRLGAGRYDPQEGWIQGVGGAAPRDIVRRRSEVHKGGH